MTSQQFQDAKNAYFMAKIKYDELKIRAHKLNAPVHDMLEQEKITIEQWADMTTDNDFRIDNEFGLSFDQAGSNLIDTEKQLLKTARVILEAKATRQQWEQLKIAFEQGPKIPKIREELIELTLKFDDEL